MSLQFSMGKTGACMLLAAALLVACDDGLTPPPSDENGPPGFTSSPVESIMIGELYSYPVMVVDPDGDMVTVIAPTLPTWLSLSGPTPGTGADVPTLVGTPTLADAGTADVLLRASDGQATADQSFQITVITPPGQITNLNDTGAGSLRDVVAQASPGATIGFAPALGGTLVLNSPIVLTKDVTIIGPGPAGITVSGGDATRLFTVDAGTRAELQSLTLANGRSAIEGGGIHNDGDLTVRRVIFRDNQALFDGGAISNDGTLLVEGSEFNGNSASADGGAISNNLFATIETSTFAGNESVVEGGAISSNGQLAVLSSTFSGNTAGIDGGAILHEGSTMSIAHSTVVNNSAGIDGGGLFADAVPFSLLNSIVFGNTANFDGPDLHGPVDSEGHNLIGNTNDAAITGDVSSNLINVDPQLSTLADNGGPSRTRALVSTSPAVDAGNCPDVSLDQRGLARPVDLPNANAANGCDIGAYEVQTPTG